VPDATSEDAVDRQRDEGAPGLAEGALVGRRTGLGPILEPRADLSLCVQDGIVTG
jgi:hypothetical protein